MARSSAASAYSNLWIVDDYSIFFHVVFSSGCGNDHSDYRWISCAREHINHAEYYALLLFATAGHAR